MIGAAAPDISKHGSVNCKNMDKAVAGTAKR
jgi:hypothetical protein